MLLGLNVQVCDSMISFWKYVQLDLIHRFILVLSTGSLHQQCLLFSIDLQANEEIEKDKLKWN